MEYRNGCRAGSCGRKFETFTSSTQQGHSHCVRCKSCNVFYCRDVYGPKSSRRVILLSAGVIFWGTRLDRKKKLHNVASPVVHDLHFSHSHSHTPPPPIVNGPGHVCPFRLARPFTGGGGGVQRGHSHSHTTGARLPGPPPVRRLHRPAPRDRQIAAVARAHLT